MGCKLALEVNHQNSLFLSLFNAVADVKKWGILQTSIFHSSGCG